MPELADKQPSTEQGAFTAGCLLLLVLVADAAAGLLVALVLAARGLGRTNTDSGRTAANSVPSPDWAPVLGFGGLALALGVTAVVLLRIGHRGIGSVRLTLCVFPAVHALGYRP